MIELYVMQVASDLQTPNVTVALQLQRTIIKKKEKEICLRLFIFLDVVKHSNQPALIVKFPDSRMKQKFDLE